MLETRKHLPNLNQEMAITIGQQLKATRMGRGLTVQQAADPLLLSVRQIECLEAGDSSLFYGARLYAQAADKYASFLHIEVMPSQMMLEYPTENSAGTPQSPAPVKETPPPVSSAPTASDWNTTPPTPAEPVLEEATQSTVIAETQPMQTSDASPQATQPPSRIKTALTIIFTAAVTAGLVLNANQLETVIRDQLNDMPSIAELTERFRSQPVEKATVETAKAPETTAPVTPETTTEKTAQAAEAESLKPAPMPMPSTPSQVAAENPTVDSAADKNAVEKPGPRNVNFAVTDKTGLMTIRFGVDSWVQAVTKSGKQRIERTYNEGDTLTVQPSNLQSLTIGNSAQVKVTADGNKLDLMPYSKGSVARFNAEQLESMTAQSSISAPAKPASTTKPVAPTSQAPAATENEKTMVAAE